MNNIIIDSNESCIDSYKGFVTINNSKVKLSISGNNEIYLKDGVNLEINVLDNASLKLIIFNDNKKSGINLNIFQNSNTHLEIIDVFKSKCDLKENIINYLIGKNNYSNITIRVVQENGHCEVLEQIIASENSFNNEAEESLKGLVCGGAITTLPNMEINTNNINANHFVTIASYDKEELLYLMSKGLKEDSAKELIKKGYLFSGINEEIRKVLEHE